MRLSALAAAGLAALVLAAGAAAGAPRFAVYNLRLDLARASHNPFGDIRLWKQRDALARNAPGATLVRCGLGCFFGSGWFAFARRPALSTGDLASASAAGSGSVWGVTLRLTPRGRARWAALARFAAQRRKERGVPDVLVFVAGDAIVAQPLADQVRAAGATLRFGGLRKADALRAAKALGGR